MPNFVQLHDYLNTERGRFKMIIVGAFTIVVRLYSRQLMKTVIRYLSDNDEQWRSIHGYSTSHENSTGHCILVVTCSDTCQIFRLSYRL